MSVTEHAVVVAGGGPTGLMLAAELAIAGVDVAVVERRVDEEIPRGRAGGLHARTLEVLDQRGVAERFISQGQPYGIVQFHIPLDISDFPTRHNYVLALWQTRTERILREWVEELPVTFYRGAEVCGFTQDDAGVDVQLAPDRTLRAQYLVGCDGGRSVVRKAAGIAFDGWDASTSWLLAEVDYAQEPAWGFREDDSGTHAIGKLDDGARAAVVVTERQLRFSGEPTLDDVRSELSAIYGTDFGIHNPTPLTRFTDAARQAATYRDRRVLLAGDAAHIHAPVGGQGLNIGVQDAVNLGWKLAQVVTQTSPESLLDTYHAERHPVAARVLRNTMAQVALRRPDDRTKALRTYLGEFLGMDGPRRRMAAEMSGLDVHYDLGAGHPLLGRRMPDLDLRLPHDTVRLYSLLHDARPLLLDFGNLDVTMQRVKYVAAQYDGAWELPVIGAITAPSAVLIRPDGYVAWVSEGTHAGLEAASTRWFGTA